MLEQINKIKTKLGKDLELINLGLVSYFLDIKITRDYKIKVIKLNQKNIPKKYYKGLINKI